MSRPAIQSKKLNEHLTLSECHPDAECHTNNWWLYDKRAGLNVSMRAATPEDTFMDAIKFWAEQAVHYKQAHKELKARVDTFVEQFKEENDSWN